MENTDTSLSSFIDGNGPTVARALLGIYLVRAGWEAVSKRLWFDELLTMHFSRVGGLGDLWRALLDAGEALPPLGFLLAGFAQFVFGEGELSMRLPSILAFGVFGYCLFRFLSPHLGTVSSLAALVFSWLTSGFYYAIEARPYALMICFGMLALISWRAAADGKYRVWGLVGLMLSLSAALSVHYYSVFLFLPLATGEAARYWKTKKVDIAIWACLVLPGATLLLYLPLIISARQRYSGSFWSPVLPFPDILGSYLVMLFPAGWVLAVVGLILIGAAVWRALKGRSQDGDIRVIEPKARFPFHEKVALLVATAIPVLAVTAASLTTGVYVYRYGLAALIGVCTAFAMIVRWGTMGQDSWRLTVLAVLIGWFAFGGPRLGVEGQGRTPMEGADPYGYEEFLQPEFSQDVPIVVSSPILFPEHFHYAPAWARERLVYVADTEAAVRYRETNTPDLNLIGVAAWSPLKVVPYDEFMAREPRFLIYERPRDRFAWLLERLQAERRGVRRVGDQAAMEIWECCVASPVTPAASAQ